MNDFIADALRNMWNGKVFDCDDDMIIPGPDSGLSVRARKALMRLGIKQWSQLADTSMEQLLDTKNCGYTTVCELQVKLQQRGLTLRP